MHSIRSLLLVTSAILGFAVVAPPSSQAADPVPLHLTKRCNFPTPPANTPSVCEVIVSNIGAIPAGTKVFYYGPRPGGNPPFISSSVVLDAGFGNTAAGYCMVGATLGPVEPPVPPSTVGLPSPVGYCAFNSGSGTLAGFQSVVKVTRVLGTPVVWYWDTP